MLHTLQAGHGKVRVRGLGVASEGELNALAVLLMIPRPATKCLPVPKPSKTWNG